MVETPDHLNQTIQFFSEKLAKHGATPQGMDYNSDDAVNARYRQILRALTANSGFSINDFGCGYGGLVNYMQSNGFSDFTYTGYDVTSAMTQAAQERFSGSAHRFVTGGAEALLRADYTVASGVFNMKLATPLDDWAEYVRQCIRAMYDASKLATSATFLTSYSDNDRMRGDLYYPDPRDMFDFAKSLSHNVAILHDYGLYDFTLVIRKSPYA